MLEVELLAQSKDSRRKIPGNVLEFDRVRLPHRFDQQFSRWLMGWEVDLARCLAKGRCVGQHVAEDSTAGYQQTFAFIRTSTDNLLAILTHVPVCPEEIDRHLHFQLVDCHQDHCLLRGHFAGTVHRDVVWYKSTTFRLYSS